MLDVFEWSSQDPALNHCLRWVLGRCQQVIRAWQRQGVLPPPATDPVTDAVLPAEIDAYLQGRSASPEPQALPQLKGAQSAAASRALRMRQVLDLDDESWMIWLMAMAPDISPEIARCYGFLQRSNQRQILTLDLAAALLGRGLWEGEGLRRHLHPNAALTRYDLVRIISDDRLESRCTICPNPDAYYALQATDELPPHLAAFAHVHAAGQPSTLLLTQQEGRILEQIRAYLTMEDAPNPVVALHGPPGTGKRARAASLAHAFGQRLLEADFSRLNHDSVTLGLLRNLGREALIRDHWLYLRGLEGLYHDNRTLCLRVLQHFEDHPAPWFVAFKTQGRPVISFLRAAFFVPTRYPTPMEAREFWNLALDGLPIEESIEIPSLAHQYPLAKGDIDHVVRIAEQDRFLYQRPGLTLHDLIRAINTRTEHRLHQLAVHIHPIHTLDQLVTTPEVIEEIKTMIARGRHYVKVFEQWGFGRTIRKTRGFSALFSGKSGTGKTMAASIIAREIGIEIYKVDLAQIVSKYIGETEKNLSAIFDEAERANVLLLFDEADSLFAKRTDVKSSHDRYANMEVNYILQRLDEYTGIAVLTSNFGDQLDDALTRRLDFRVEFPFPDEEQRAFLWQSMIPKEAEVDEDIDFDVLGESFEIAGGHIKNAVLRAAFLGAELNVSLNHDLMMRAAYLEMRSMGHLIAEHDYFR